MENKKNGILLRRALSLMLCLVLAVSLCPQAANAREAFVTVPFRIDEADCFIDMKVISDTLYCRADHLAQAAGCEWNYNETSEIVGFYLDTPVLLASRGLGEYVLEDSIVWVPFFENAADTGLFFSGVSDGQVVGYRATPLAVIRDHMDNIFAQENYRITSLILSLDNSWLVASVGARGYAILSSGLIKGFAEAVSGKMEQDVYNDCFAEMLKTDETLMSSLSDTTEAMEDDVEILHFLQKSLEEDGAAWELLEALGFSQKEIENIVWELGQVFYGDKTINDLTDLYEVSKLTNLVKFLGILDVICASVEADAGTIMAIQEVFGNSSSAQIQTAAHRAIGARTSGALAAGSQYSAEYILEVLMDLGVDLLDEAYETYYDISSLDKLAVAVVVKAMDVALALDDKSDAIRYSEVYSLLQLDMAGYYYDHWDDDAPDNASKMHSLALLYLRTCRAAYQCFAFDSSLEDNVGYAVSTLEAEIKTLSQYTQEELLQSGTGDETIQAISDHVKALLSDPEPEPTEPEPTEPEPTEPEPTIPSGPSNAHLYQEALDAYGQLLSQGIVLDTDDGTGVDATHYYLFDMNGDDLPEMIVFAVKDLIPSFNLYAYEDGMTMWVANSLITCDLSSWYNASHTLSIYDERYVFARAEKSTAGYFAESTALLTYDGRFVEDIYPGSYSPDTQVPLVFDGKILGGIEIGSPEDFLAGYGADDPTDQPGGDPGPVSDGTYYYAMAEYPFYDGTIFHVNIPQSWQDLLELGPGYYGARLARISMEHNMGYEWTMDLYVDEIVDNGDGTFTMLCHTPREGYLFLIESDGYMTIQASDGYSETGWGPRIQWFTPAQLEFSGGCTFADERWNGEEDSIEMTLDEIIAMLDYTYARGTDWVDVTITVEGGKITRMVLPYQP